MTLSSKSKGVIAIVTSAFGFAVMASCVRLCDSYGASVSCFEKSFFRNLVALALSLVVFLRTEENVAKDRGIPRSGRAWLVLFARCFLGTVGTFANFYALSHIPIADGQALNKTAPFFTVCLAWLLLGERMRLRQLLAVFIAFGGMLLVVRPGFAGDDAFALSMGLFGGACAGGAYAAVRALGTHKVSPTLIVLVFSAFSCLLSIPLALVDYTPLTLAQVLVLVGAGAGAAVGQYGITLAYRFAAPREIAVFDYSNIFFTAILGYLLFGQVSDWLSIVGFAVIILAAFVLAKTREPKT